MADSRNRKPSAGKRWWRAAKAGLRRIVRPALEPPGVVLAAVVAVALVAAIDAWSPGLLAAQRATGATFPGLLAGGHRYRDLYRGIGLDLLFIVAYVWLAWGLIRLVSGSLALRTTRPAAWAATTLLFAAAAADLVEDGCLFVALRLGPAPAPAGWLATMRFAGVVKWSLLAAAFLAALAFVAQRPWRRKVGPVAPLDPVAAAVGELRRRFHRTFHPPSAADAIAEDGADPEPATRRRAEPEPPRWDLPPAGEEKIGICLSGGGIRSAAFALGALQGLDDHEKLHPAAHLAAASGGGYLAAGWAVSQAADGHRTPRPWTAGSPEERWFRNHSSYLVPDATRGAMGLLRLLGGVVINLLLVWLLLFTVARPVGWAIHHVHPELHATHAYLAHDHVAEMRVAALTAIPGEVVGPDGQPIDRFAFTLAPVTATPKATATDPDPNPDHRPGQICFDHRPFHHPAALLTCTTLGTREAGVVEVVAGRASVVRQPTLCIVREEGGCPVAEAVPAVATDGVRDPVILATLRIGQKPKVSMQDDVLPGRPLGPADLEVDTQPTVRSISGLAELGYPTYRDWMWEASGGLLAAGIAIALGVMAVRLDGNHNRLGRALAGTLAATAAATFLITIGLPWLMIWIPRTLASAVGLLPEAPGKLSPSGSGLQDYLLPGGGFLAVAIAAARTYLTPGTSSGPATTDAPRSSGWLSKVWKALNGQRQPLGWYGTSPLRIVLAVIAVVVPFVLFVGQLQYAVANGPGGRLMGFAFVRDSLPYALWLPDHLKLAIVVALLAAFWVLVDAHAWSLYPFYKFRLSEAFMVRRTDADTVVARTNLAAITFGGSLDPTRPSAANGPQLVLCCAVNLSEYGVVPPGRRAASFTFSSTEIGGPVVGYASPTAYAAGMGPDRHRDISVPAAMAISGAAFSPAMGKRNLGPMGPVLALANLRLGVWLPSPRKATDGHHGATYVRRRSRPSWWWYLHELRNRYPLDGDYLYVTDGGHWDNLGLVELLRRRCTEIYCISCAGDGPTSFGTIGEAIALAREEAGVECEVILDPSDLRSPAADPEAPPSRELRRRGSVDTPAHYAARPAVTGRIRYTADDGTVRWGTLHYVEADLTADLPFDVHTFAEAEVVFPDDSTADQVFDHRQFESYRRLGRHQADGIFDQG